MAPPKLSDFTRNGTPLRAAAIPDDLADCGTQLEMTGYLVKQLLKCKFSNVHKLMDEHRVSYGNPHCDTT
jgi:hypothetical protein